MNSLLKYLPLLDVTELQKRGSISMQKEGQVTRFIEASLAAAPKDKERSECIWFTPQNNTQEGHEDYGREEDQ